MVGERSFAPGQVGERAYAEAASQVAGGHECERRPQHAPRDAAHREAQIAVLRRRGVDTEPRDAAEVRAGFDCGMSIEGFNDMKEGDVIESYEMREVKRSL